MQVSPGIVTFLFTEIEGSSRLWEQEPKRMREVLARHDTVVITAVRQHDGGVIKTLGDGIHAVHEDPLDAVNATIELQGALADSRVTDGIAVKVRCGLHAGVEPRRDDEFVGRSVNRAARIMGAAAHGGQVLISNAVAELVNGRLPDGVELRDLGNVRLRDLASPALRTRCRVMLPFDRWQAESDCGRSMSMDQAARALCEFAERLLAQRNKGLGLD